MHIFRCFRIFSWNMVALHGTVFLQQRTLTHTHILFYYVYRFIIILFLIKNIQKIYSYNIVQLLWWLYFGILLSALIINIALALMKLKRLTLSLYHRSIFVAKKKNVYFFYYKTMENSKSQTYFSWDRLNLLNLCR